jgi:hypothetical protein
MKRRFVRIRNSVRGTAVRWSEGQPEAFQRSRDIEINAFPVAFGNKHRRQRVFSTIDSSTFARTKWHL